MRIATLLLIGTTLCFASCTSGPSYLSRSVDDRMNKSYTESPIGTALLSDVIPVYPIIKVLAWIPDFLILNPIQFWTSDVLDGKGAGFRHKNPSPIKEPWFK